MATEDIKKMEKEIVNFASKLEMWMEAHQDKIYQEDDDFSTNWTNIEQLKSTVVKKRRIRKRRIYQEAKQLANFIKKNWPRSKVYSKEPVLNFLRLMYKEFSSMEVTFQHTSEEVQDAFYVILDILEDVIFECTQKDFDTHMIDWKYIVYEHKKVIEEASHITSTVDQHSSTQFNPFPEIKLYTIKNAQELFSTYYMLQFYIDKFIMTPECNILVRIVHEIDIDIPTEHIEYVIKNIIGRDLLLISKKVYKELKNRNIILKIAPYQRKDFPHMETKNRQCIRWFEVILADSNHSKKSNV